MIRRSILILSLAIGCTLPAWAATAQDQVAEIQDIMQLVERGVSDDVIVRHIEARGFVFTLTDDDLAELRDRGVSEAVLDAMVATATPDESISSDPTERIVMEDDDPDLYFYMSPGYFTPWYRYPVAWGFYYDPFPYYYSSYYYPVFYAGWGWYGHCNYWSSPYWGPGWCNPGWYNDCVAYRGQSVPVPRNPPASRWESGRGLPTRDVALPRARAGESVDRARNGRSSTRATTPRGSRSVTQPTDRSVGGPVTVHHPSRGTSRYAGRIPDRSRVRVAEPGRQAQSTVRPGSRSTAPTVRSRLESARAPRVGSAPRSSSTPRASAPRYSSPTRSSMMSAVRSPRVGASMRSASWAGGGRASAPRAGGSFRGR